MRVLLFAEAVTLAHVARIHVLANTLPPERFDVLVARHPRYDKLFGDAAYRTAVIDSVPTEDFLAALASGAPVYKASVLTAYVEDDLRVIDEYRPDVIVGDFRLSLSISARLCELPYLGVSNAYWSPNAKVPFLAPDLPATRWLGQTFADLVFKSVRPFAFAVHASPLNQVRRLYGLPSLGPDLRRVYTDADLMLYADVPELVPLSDCSGREKMIGPLPWSPHVPLPDWWSELPAETPTAYVTLGSSGDRRLLSDIVMALAKRGMNVLVSTAGGEFVGPRLNNVFVADYLPGFEASSRASIVVCNGGSPTTYQGLSAGAPILGIPSNLDQVLNMSGLDRAGVGTMIRGLKRMPERIGNAVDRLETSSEVASRVRRVRASLQAHQDRFNFPRVLESIESSQRERILSREGSD